MKDFSSRNERTSRTGCWWVLTADQVDSRRHEDAVPAALANLEHVCGASMRLGFERTVGDELQGLSAESVALVTAVTELTRLGGWRIGVGLGPVETPLPLHSREARGPAFIAAREAIALARRQSTRIALVAAMSPDGPPDHSTVGAPIPSSDSAQESADAPDRVDGREPSQQEPSKTVSPLPYGGSNRLDQLAQGAESALIVLRALLARRTPEGWQAVQLLDSGMSHRQVADTLGITESAVSQRLTRAQRDEVVRAQQVARLLMDAAQQASSPASTSSASTSSASTSSPPTSAAPAASGRFARHRGARPTETGDRP